MGREHCVCHIQIITLYIQVWHEPGAGGVEEVLRAEDSDDDDINELQFQDICSCEQHKLKLLIINGAQDNTTKHLSFQCLKHIH